MDLSKFTPDQQKAIKAEGSNVLVSAGAGSGKTQVLTARVVYFVGQKGYKLDQFLILTFTKLAAGEMKKRIREKLTSEGLLEAVSQVDSANICTFDSYALNIVKKYHFLLNISPNVSIIDKTIIDVKKRNIIDEIFERLYKERDDGFCKMIEHFCLKDDKDIRKLILKVYDRSLLEIDTDKYLDEFEENYYSKKKFEEIISFVVKEIKSLSKKIATTIENIPSNLGLNDGSGYIQKYLTDLFGPLFKAKSYDDLIKVYSNLNLTRKGDFENITWTSNSRSIEANKATNACKKAIDKLEEFFESLPKTRDAAFEDLEETKPYASVIIRIIKELDKSICAYKDLNGVYEFNDIAKMALKLVEENEEVRNEIKSSLKMIMIDEYQDTSSLQDGFIEKISDNNVYMVGDVKQSIYRFRNAEVSIFIDKYEDYKKNGTGQVIDMNKNFRSRREVLDDINYIFKQLMSKKRGGADYRKEHMIQFGQQDYIEAGPKDVDSHVRILGYSLNENEKKNPEIEAKLIARDIINKINNSYLVMDYDNNKKPHLRPVRFSDFCILMDRGSAFDKYQRVFNDLKLPIYVENDEKISMNVITLVLTNLLKMINFIKTDGFDYKDEYFKKVWLSLARSFLFAYDDESIYQIYQKGDLAHEKGITAKIREIVLNNYSSSSYELFETIIYELGIYSKCVSLGDVEKNHKYLDYFLSMFKSMSELNYSISDFISYMENLKEYRLDIKLSSTGTSIDSVRIMNIHKSKGLEFNIVYLAGTYKQFNDQYSKDSYSMSPKFGLVMRKEADKANLVKEVNNVFENEEDTSERIRQLYVALTRTREQLIIPLELNKETEADPIDVDGLNAFLKGTYASYANRDIDEDALLATIGSKGFEPTYQFVSMNDEEKHSIPLNESSDYFVERGKTDEEEFDFKSLRKMLLPFIHCGKFEIYTLPITDEQPALKNPPKAVEHHPLKVDDSFKIKYNVNQVSRASKQLSLTVNKDALDFGTKMHFLLETTDFDNPNLSDMDMNEKKIITRFLSQPFMSNIKEGKAFKEYEYHDDLNNVNGTIDLMVIYPDHIDVIDYKTKNIDDASYDKQIGVYMDYVQRTFNMKVNGYLYSLMTGEYKTY